MPSWRARSSNRNPSPAGSTAPGAGDVEVQPVRVQVVCDVEVEPSVRVHVREDRSETVVEVPRLEAGALSHLAEAGPALRVRALVEVEAVAHADMVGREAGGGGRDRGVGVGVPGHEQIRAPVAVHVPDRGTGVPARGVDPGRARAFREGAVTVSPEERVVPVGGDVVARGRHVEIRLAVEVEVSGDAAAAREAAGPLPSRGSRPRIGRARCGRARCGGDRRSPSSGRIRRPHTR